MNMLPSLTRWIPDFARVLLPMLVAAAPAVACVTEAGLDETAEEIADEVRGGKKARCGDGACQKSESCSSCPADCGACTAPEPSDPSEPAPSEPSSPMPCSGGTCPSPLWHADADTNGMSAWKGQQEAYPDRLDLVSDPEGRYGQVYQAMLVDGDLYKDGKARCELYGSKLPNGSDLRYREGDNLFFGWRSRINEGFAAPLKRANSGNLTQFKGDSSCGGPAIVLTIKYGAIALRSELYGELWYGPMVTDFAGAWHDIVVNINFSKSATSGFVELWLDGAKQTFVDGSTRFRVATMCPDDAYVYLKQGIYRSTELTGTAYHWIESPRIGTSYDSVVPR
jgi:hypothetical protein